MLVLRTSYCLADQARKGLGAFWTQVYAVVIKPLGISCGFEVPVHDSHIVEPSSALANRSVVGALPGSGDFAGDKKQHALCANLIDEPITGLGWEHAVCAQVDHHCRLQSGTLFAQNTGSSPGLSTLLRVNFETPMMQHPLSAQHDRIPDGKPIHIGSRRPRQHSDNGHHRQ